MKNLKLLLIAVLYLCTINAEIFSQVFDSKTIAFIDSLVSSNYASNGPGMSLLIAKDGIPLYKKAHGMANLELKVPLSTDNVFAIGSMSKQITAVAILQLADQEKLNLTDNINKYLTDYNSHNRVITIENCLTHTSGIPSFTELSNFDSIYQKKLSKMEMVDFFEEKELLFEPGSDFSYSNSGYYLLGLIIEKISGKTYEEYIQKNIFDKAGMKHSYFESMTNIIPVRAAGYDGRDSATYQNASYYERSWAIGAGNIMSTTGDLLIWNEALITDLFASKELLQKAFTSYKLSNGISANYGYGWNVTPLNNYTIIKHGGAINGYLSDGVSVPEERFYIAALTNTTGKSPDEITTKILMKILNVSIDDPKIISLNKNLYNDYVGAFEVNRDGGRLLKNFTNDKQYRYIFVEGDSLMLQRTGGGKFSLHQYAKDKFFTKGTNKRFDFTRDASGRVTALDVYSYPINLGPYDFCKKVDVEMPVTKKEISVSEDIMKNYNGEFELQPGFNLKIFTENGNLFLQATGQDKVQLYPESNTKYFIKEVDAQVEFIPEADGSVNKLILNQGKKFECKRIR